MSALKVGRVSIDWAGLARLSACVLSTAGLVFWQLFKSDFSAIQGMLELRWAKLLAQMTTLFWPDHSRHVSTTTSNGLHRSESESKSSARR